MSQAEKIALLFDAVETLAAEEQEITVEHVWYLVERFDGMTRADVEQYLQ